MISFKEFYYLRKHDEVVVIAPEASIPNSALLNEGTWIESGKKDWMLRVDAADPSIPLQRHVHIACRKHTAAKSQQASWNQDGTRHDRRSFNASVGSLRVVQDLARSALNLPTNAVLEHVVQPGSLLLESSAVRDGTRVLYLRVAESVA